MYSLLKAYSAPGTLHDLPERKESSDLLTVTYCGEGRRAPGWDPGLPGTPAPCSQHMARRSIALSTIVPTGTLILSCNQGSRRTFPHFRLPPKEGERGRGQVSGES